MSVFVYFSLTVTAVYSAPSIRIWWMTVWVLRYC